MSVEILTYTALGARLNISPEAARSLATRLRLPRSLSHDGKALVSVDLAEIRHTPRPPGTHQAGTITLLTTKIEALQAEIARLEAREAAQRADRQRQWSRGMCGILPQHCSSHANARAMKRGGRKKRFRMACVAT